MGTTDFLLNCFVLGDDEERVFPVEIPRDKNVGILKDKIKKKRAHLLSDIDASDLDLWKVCLPIDHPTSKQPQTGPPLKVNKRLSLLWDGDPSDDDLHILVKAPGASKVSSSDFSLISPAVVHAVEHFSLNCLVFGDNKVFTVKVPKADNVSILKGEIKKEVAPHFDHVAAKDLEVYQVSLRADDNVVETLKNIPLEPLNYCRTCSYALMKPTCKSLFKRQLPVSSFSCSLVTGPHPCLAADPDAEEEEKRDQVGALHKRMAV